MVPLAVKARVRIESERITDRGYCVETRILRSPVRSKMDDVRLVHLTSLNTRC